MTNRSKFDPLGMPCRDTFIVSLSLPVVMVTRPPACGRQAAMPGDGTNLNENVLAAGDAVLAPAVATNAAVTPRATAPPAAPSLALVEPKTRWVRDLVVLMAGCLPVD